MARKRKPTAIQQSLENKRQLKALQDKERIDTIVKAANKVTTQAVAATILGISQRQVRRLVDAYRNDGPEAVLHQGRGKPSNNRRDEVGRKEAMGIVKDSLLGSGPTLVSDELNDLHGIELPTTTVRRWMLEEGLWTAKEPGKASHRRWRERKAHPGQMVQMDTSEHPWFGPDRDKAYCIALIDDSTSRLYARFYRADSTLTNMDALRGYMAMYGRPLSLYTDKASHFTDNPPKGAKLSGCLPKKGPVTQFQRALSELNITQILAHSPQAKGRIERLFGTLQDRLLHMMKHRGIENVEVANEFLGNKFIAYWNDKFTHPPANAADLHRTLVGFDVAAILSEQDVRTVTNDYTFNYCGSKYQIEPGDMDSRMRRAKVTIEKRLDGSLRARFNGKYIHFYQLDNKKI